MENSTLMINCIYTNPSYMFTLHRASLCFTTLLLAALSAKSQTIGTPYPKDRDLIEEGIKLHDAEKYDEAIAKYSLVNPNDSFYSEALHELATSYQASNKFTQAAEAALNGLNLKNESRREFLLLYANALEELKMFDSALATYNSGQREFPYYNRFQYEKGLSYAKNKQWTEALETYTASAQNNIFHPATHYRMGFMAADAHEPVLALLALQTYLILSNTGSNVLYTVDQMEKISNNEYTSDTEVPSSLYTKASLPEINEIVLSKAALSKKYKSKVDLNFWVVKQLQVTLEKLPENYESGNWLFDFYVQFYKSIWSKNHFEGMMLYSLQGIESKEIQKVVKSNQSKINAFSSWTVDYFTKIRNDRTVTLGGKQVKTKLWYNGSSLDAMGDENASGQSVGYWQYYRNGFLRSKGTYNQLGKKTGEWLYYYYNGNLKALENFDDQGVLNGKYESYYENGNLEERSTYLNGKFDGETLLYNINGTMMAKFTYQNGKRNGVRYNYNSNGLLENEGMLKDGDYTGYYKTYYTNGKIELSCEVLKGNIVGEVTYLHRNGKLKAKGSYSQEGKRTGNWKWYHDNGILQSEGNYTNDNQSGLWKYYYKTGTLKEESIFENGKLKGINKSYDENGKLWDETVYKNGKADSYKNYDRDGKIIAQEKTAGGKLKVVNFNQYRNKTSEGVLVNSAEEGIWKYYHANGNLKYEVEYTKGKLNGILKFYFKNGKPKYELKYVDGQREGYYKSFYLNGKVEVEGYYQNDEQHGPWKYYHSNGNLDVTEFYQEGALFGKAETYMPDGKIYTRSDYKYGFFNNLNQFDTAGNIIYKTNLVNGTGAYELHTYKGKPTYKAQYVGGKRNGLVTSYYGNNKVKITENYQMGKREGEYRSFHENGKPSSMGKYDEGEMDSIWSYYNEKGELYRTISYLKGESEGPDKSYSELGKLEIDKNYKDDVRHGEYTYYGFDGTIIYRANYENGVLKSYTWLGKDGKLLPLTPVVDETATINTFYPNGNKALSFKIEKGYNQGPYLVYYPDGKLREEILFVDGNYENTFKMYYPNGNLRFTKDYFFDDYNGTVTEYHENGKVASETPYLMDYKHGVAKYYDATGKLIKTVKYVYGVSYE